MTPDEKRLLEFVTERINATGMSPTYQEMANAVGCKTKSGIARRIESLIQQGYLVRRDRAYRGLALNTSPLAEVPTAALQAELDRRNRESGR